MQLARWIGVVGLLVAGTALAAQGDALLVTGNNVNVRAGPSTQAGILARVDVDEPAIERRRQGEWVEVELPNQDVLGWIHGSLLDSAANSATTAPPQRQGETAGEVTALDLGSTDAGGGAAIAAAATDESDASPLGRFRRVVERFNDGAVAAAGIDLFTGVASLDGGGVQVVTTDAWAIMPEPGRQSYLNALFERWQAVAGAGQALRLQIVDASGALMMEKSGP